MLLVLLVLSIHHITKPPGMQSSIFGSVPSQDKLRGLWQEEHPVKNWGDDGGGGIDGPDVVVSSRIVGALASIIFPTPHNDDRLPQHI